MPDHWKLTSLDQISKLVGGNAFPRKEQGGSAGLPFVKVSDMNRLAMRLELLTPNFVTAEQVERMRQ